MLWQKGLDLRAMSVFLEMARSGNMAEAAARLGITQPAVSQYISKTEDAVGAILLDRQMRPARLTPAGEVFRDRAETLMRSAEAAVSAVRNVGTQPLPELRVAVPNSIAATLTPWIYAFVGDELKPGNFSLRVGQAVDHVRALLEREVDLVITSETIESLAGIDRYPLFRESFVLMTSAGFDVTDKSITDISRELPLIRFSGHNVVGQLVERHLRRMRLHLPRTAEFDTAQAVAAMVSAGHGFAIATPMCVLEGEAIGHDVVCSPFPGPAFSRTLYLFARGQELGDRAEIFAEQCRRVLIQHIAPRVAARMPWLNDGFEVLPSDDT